MKILKKISSFLLLTIIILTLYSCDFLNGLEPVPMESPVPQTMETVTLITPLNQDISIKPCFDGIIPDEEPYRNLEHADVNEAVKNEADLINAGLRGRKPVFPIGSVYRVLYNNVLKILNTIIKNDMTDYGRIHAIYDYLIYYTNYDFDILNDYLHNSSSITGLENAFTIKGVIEDNLAVCDGFSKTFSLMCSIEGIKNVIVSGEAYSEGNGWINHAWNKVLLDEKWYIVDSTHGSFAVKMQNNKINEFLTHAFLLISDSDITHKEISLKPVLVYKLDEVKANKDYGFYQKEFINNGYEINAGTILPRYKTNHVFSNKVSLDLYLKYLNDNKIKAAEFYLDMSDAEKEACLLTYKNILNIYEVRKNVYYTIS